MGRKGHDVGFLGLSGIFVNYLQKVKTINSEYYWTLLEKFEKIAAKRPHKLFVFARQCAVTQEHRNPT